MGRGQGCRLLYAFAVRKGSGGPLAGTPARAAPLKDNLSIAARRGVQKTFKCVLSNSCKSVCAYCGALAECRDHYLPWSQFHRPLYLPSCSQCNGLLGSTVLPTYSDRCQCLIDRYRKKFRKVLRTDYERALRGSVGQIRRLLEAENNLKGWILKKIDVLTSIANVMKDVQLSDLHTDTEALSALELILSRC